MNIRIRQVRPEDLPSIAALEAACFPAAEAADSAAFEQRIKTFPESFFVAEVEGQIVGMINGCVTDDETISDILFEDSSRHHPDGRYQSIFGLDVLPDWQHKGIATILMTYLIHKAMDSGREGLILTCKERLISFYESFGYQNLGVSASTHGGAVWYDMLLAF